MSYTPVAAQPRAEQAPVRGGREPEGAHLYVNRESARLLPDLISRNTDCAFATQLLTFLSSGYTCAVFAR